MLLNFILTINKISYRVTSNKTRSESWTETK